MTKHNRRQIRSIRRTEKIAAIAAVSVVLLAILAAWAKTPPPSNESRRSGFPFYASEEEAKPFPETLDPKLFSTRHVSHAYRVAKEIPGVLAQQPCFCECRSYGHDSLLACFASNHAAGCTICMQETLLADRLTKEGKTPSEIRDAIIQGMWRNQRIE